jgi:hypothetical protein
VGLALLIVVAVPDFALVLGVLGSACSFTVTIAFPCACYLRLYWDEVRPHMSIPPAHTPETGFKRPLLIP